jgi:hypothetical protein
MNSLVRLLARVKARITRSSPSGEEESHHHFPSLPPKRDRNRHSQREFRHRDRTLAPGPEEEAEEQ